MDGETILADCGEEEEVSRRVGRGCVELVNCLARTVAIALLLVRVLEGVAWQRRS